MLSEYIESLQQTFNSKNYEDLNTFCRSLFPLFCICMKNMPFCPFTLVYTPMICPIFQQLGLIKLSAIHAYFYFTSSEIHWTIYLKKSLFLRYIGRAASHALAYGQFLPLQMWWGALTYENSYQQQLMYHLLYISHIYERGCETSSTEHVWIPLSNRLKH